MTRRLTLLILILSILVEMEYFLELVLYDELPTFPFWKLIFVFLSFGGQTFLQFLAIFYVNIRIISFLEKKYPWEKSFTIRSLIEFLLTSIVAVGITVPAVVWIDHGFLVPLYGFPSDGVQIAVYYNILYMVAINALFVVTYEVVFLYTQRKQVQLRWEIAEKQTVISRFEALKNQVNPHFLFNSLSGLSELLQNDPEKASFFLEEFLKVYRRILSMETDLTIPLADELEFARNYINLQKIRFGEDLHVVFDEDPQTDGFRIPPFSIQLLLENAIKHNAISSDHPLKVEVGVNEEWATVSNNINPLSDKPVSTQIGLSNLKDRYSLLSDLQPDFEESDQVFRVKLPILKN